MVPLMLMLLLYSAAGSGVGALDLSSDGLVIH